MLDEQQERVIAQGLREGKTDAWQALYDAYAERVWRAIARLLGPRCTDVADVVQETLMAAARSAHKFDAERGSLWQWLWGIAHNHAVLHLRKQALRTRPVAVVPSSIPSPSESVIAAELARNVRAALTTLPADYAWLLTARYLDGDTVAVIAMREHVTEVAVRSKLARARQAFREAFGKYAPVESGK